ncbi:MAG TPA: type II secretion system F family protein, partial [Planctomycetota bacterium]|nr:type II secretion system F family protein [Planctomycetota bacterium]
MPVYTYKAFTTGGQVKSGIADADSPREARLKLRRDGLLVTDLAEVEGITRKKTSRWRQMRLRRRTARELPQTTRQLATLLRSGIALNDALKALVEQIETPVLEAVFRDVRERIGQGASFAEALEQHPGVFPPLFVSMVRSGEAAGNTDVVLERLALFMQKQSRMKNRVVAAMIYPLIMLFVGTIVVIVLMTKVVPKLIVLVESRGGELPGPTAALKAISEFLAAYWYLILAAVILINMAVGAIRRTPAGRYRTDQLLLGLPIFGDLFKKQAISRFAITLSTLLKTGVPVLDALRIVRDVVGNSVLAKVLDDLHSAILRGADIATPLKRSGIFPPAVGYMIAVGEQSGELEHVLDRLAEAYETEVEVATERLTAVIEPMMILIMAVVVAFIVMSIILPML